MNTASGPEVVRKYLAPPVIIAPQVFRDPPREFGMVPFWSWNSDLDPDEIRRQIRLFVEQHVYAAFMHARGGIEASSTPYFSDGWWQAVDAAVDEGRQLGFQPWMYDEDKWPSGFAGGRTVAADPEHNRPLRMEWREQDIIGPAELRLHEPGAYAVVAGRIAGEKRLGELVDLTDLATNPAGPARWEVPRGQWKVIVARPFRLQGDMVNYLRRETVADFIRITHEEYFRRYGRDFGAILPGIFFDEIHNSGGDVVWAENFDARFQEGMGYTLRGFIPALRYDIGPLTEKIRCDYYQVYAELYEKAWFKQTAEWCQALEFLRPGENRITVIVANLLANSMFYRMVNGERSTVFTRYWHDGNIRREIHMLESGLLAPPQLRLFPSLRRAGQP